MLAMEKEVFADLHSKDPVVLQYVVHSLQVLLSVVPTEQQGYLYQVMSFSAAFSI